MHKRMWRTALLVGASCSAMASTMAWAAPAPPGDQGSNVLQEIVVTARKREENVQATPLAITALNGAMLQKAQVNSIEDLSSLVPSLLTRPQASIGATATLSLRGFSDTNPTNLMGDGPVAVYIDGVYEGREDGDAFNLVDMARVEVEAGPQGTLFGRNVTGGAISMFTKAPAKSFGMEEKLSYATYNERMSRTTLDTGELGDTGFYAKLAYMHRDSEGYGVTNTLAPKKSDEPGAYNANAYFLALHGNLGPNITVDYKFDWNVETQQSYATQPIGGSAAFVALHSVTGHGGTPMPILGTPGPFCPSCNGGVGAPTFEIQPNFLSTVSQTYVGPNQIQSGGHNLTLNWTVNDDTSIKSISGYRSLHLVSNDNFGGNADNSLVFPSFTYAPVPILTTFASQVNQYQFSEELQLNGKFNRFTYVAGLYYFDEHVGDANLNTQAYLPIVFPPLVFGVNVGFSVDQLYKGESASRAGYFDLSYKPSGLDDKLEFSGGIRYTWDTKSLNQTPITMTGPANTTPLLHPPISVKHDFFNIAGSGAVKYQWTRDVMTYLRVGNSYKAGGFNPGNTTLNPITHQFDVNVYGPEGALSYEAGIKSEWLDHHVRLNADAYYTDYTGLQISVLGASSGAFAVTTQNAGRARFFGFEGDITILPADGWQLDGTLGLIAPKFLQYQTSSSPTGNIAAVAKVPNLPETTASVAAQYSFKSTPLGDLTTRVSWSYRSRTFSAADPTVTPYIFQGASPAYNDVGVQISLAHIPVSSAVNLEAEFFGKDLLDQRDVLMSTDVISGLGFANEAWGPGRTFGVMLTGKF